MYSLLTTIILTYRLADLVVDRTLLRNTLLIKVSYYP